MLETTDAMNTSLSALQQLIGAGQTGQLGALARDVQKAVDSAENFYVLNDVFRLVYGRP
jgi:hypothetical protein